MMALGCLASISLTGIVDGTISEYTWHSRTRRAMSWAYCAPKSTTRTVSNPPGADTPTPSTRVFPWVGAQCSCLRRRTARLAEPGGDRLVDAKGDLVPQHGRRRAR